MIITAKPIVEPKESATIEVATPTIDTREMVSIPLDDLLKIKSDIAAIKEAILNPEDSTLPMITLRLGTLQNRLQAFAGEEVNVEVR